MRLAAVFLIVDYVLNFAELTPPLVWVPDTRLAAPGIIGPLAFCGTTLTAPGMRGPFFAGFDPSSSVSYVALTDGGID